MNPRLLAVAGPLKGQSFVIAGAGFSIGRHASNDLVIAEKEVSRDHCSIAWTESGFAVQDLGSRRGTLVNGRAVRTECLVQGDRVTVGHSTFILLLDEDPAETECMPRDAVEFHDAGFRDTAVLKSSGIPTRGELTDLVEATSRGEGDASPLAALLDAAAAMQEVRGWEEIGQRLLPLVLEAIPGDRAALVLTDETGEPTEAVSYAIFTEGPFRVSRTVLRRTVRDRVAMLAKDLAELGELGGVESIDRAQLRALLCVPLLARGRPCGALYVDTRRTSERFTETHLRIATALGGLAAAAVENARYLDWLKSERQHLLSVDAAPDLLGESLEIEAVRAFISRVAPTDSTVLLCGESGTGKELAARAIHRSSGRSDRPFVVLNCAALPESLLESEVFGHEKGAFTGAVARQRGRLEVADTGTVFLDEVGELSTALQAKLLRVLEQREFERVGSTRPIKVDIRVIAATNRDLAKAVRDGLYRKDLYYRLNVLSCTLPPLRERSADIPLLVRHFVGLHGRRLNRPPMPVSHPGMASLMAYDWPGNVRELSNAIERAVVLAHDEEIRPEDLPEALLEGQPPGEASGGDYHHSLTRFKAKIVRAALEETGGNVTTAAERLGLHPKYLYRLVHNLGLKPKRPGA